MREQVNICVIRRCEIELIVIELRTGADALTSFARIDVVSRLWSNPATERRHAGGLSCRVRSNCLEYSGLIPSPRRLSAGALWCVGPGVGVRALGGLAYSGRVIPCLKSLGEVSARQDPRYLRGAVWFALRCEMAFGN